MRQPDEASLWPRFDEGPRRGFALLVSISLMSMILMLLVGLSTYTQTELAAASADEQVQQARENARLGLLVALGELQSAAGPDQRVTARAEILGDINFHSQNRYWTGVWNTTNMNADPVWLVSGRREVDILDDTLLAGDGFFGPIASRHVRAGKEPVSDLVGTGSYAYWVSDEGVKVSLGKNSDLDQYQDTANALKLSDLELKRLRQASGDRARFETLFSQAESAAALAEAKRVWRDVWEEEIGDDVARASNLGQLELHPAFGQPEAGQVGGTTELAYHRPDVTYISKGVLVNTDDGGFKIDLSNPAAADPGGPFLLNDQLRSFLTQRVNVEDRAKSGGVSAIYSGGATAVGISVGDPVNAIGPVVTEFGIYLGVYRMERTIGRNEIKLDVSVRADIWNPYAVNLGATPTGIDDFEIQIEGLPSLSVDWVTSRDQRSKRRSGSFSVNLKNLKLTDHNDSDDYRLSRVPVDLHDDMSVGEVRTISERSYAILNRFITDESGSSDDYVAISAPRTELTVRLVAPDGRLIQEFKNIEFDRLDTEDYGDQKFLQRTGKPEYSLYQAVYHWMFRDDVVEGDLEAWSSQKDPRSLIMSPSDADQGFFHVSEDPGFAAYDEAVFLGRPAFFYGGSDNLLARNYHRFFDFPTTDIISVGFLQHLHFHQKRPFAIGNPWGGDHNEAFDRYFFSTLGNGRNHGDPLPNHHLEALPQSGVDPTRAEEAAGSFLVSGAFNINSTSVEAWKALISSVHLYDWDYRIFEENTHEGGTLHRDHVKNCLFRFTHGADRTFMHPTSTPDYRINHYPEATQRQREEWYRKYWQPDWRIAYTLGMRELRDGDNADQIDDVTELAEAIVAELQAREMPFASIKELANSGLLQDAIDATRINTVSHRSYVDEASFLKKIPRYAPSFVTQADLLTLLAPYASARSDTFIIRAYGEAPNKLTGKPEGRAWCEALVQRVPHPVGVDRPSAAQIQNPPTSQGRRFEIINFRWLDESEI
ncbi:MAG: hypothetical protein ACQKBV_04025 [Puniceicoccales bacterium]